MRAHSDSEFCSNCGIRLSGRFCAACGQKALPPGVTLHDFVHEATHEMLHVDGRIFQSIRRLMTSPGFLTREYLAGRRSRWISPIRLYLVFSFAFFAITALTPMRVSQRQNAGGVPFSAGRSGSRIGISGGNGQDPEEKARQLGHESLDELRQEVSHAWLTWAPRAMFVLVPLFASLVALMYRRVDGNYLHHLIFALHLHGAWFAAGAVAAAANLVSAAAGEFLETAVLIYVPVYSVIAFGKVFGRARWRFVRMAVVLGGYGIVVLAALVAIVLPAVMPVFSRMRVP